MEDAAGVVEDRADVDAAGHERLTGRVDVADHEDQAVDGARLGGRDPAVHAGTSCWPPSTSYVAPVSAVLTIRWTASAATSPGPTTRPIGSVARSWSRRCSSWSPSSEADNGV